mgnify:CR=1 FL=1
MHVEVDFLSKLIQQQVVIRKKERESKVKERYKVKEKRENNLKNQNKNNIEINNTIIV